MLLRAFLLALLVQTASTISYAQKSKSPDEGASFYKLRPDDSDAVYFTPQNFKIKADGKTDVSDVLQQAINDLKRTHNFGVLFIPQGTYLVTKTIYIPTAIRLIGYGDKRPEFVLGKNSPGFQSADSTDKGKAHYMFWFTSGVVQPGRGVPDAGASTFYSAMSNINLRIEDGNPHAIALRTHFAQHSFVSHLDIHIGNGKAGLFDVGNELSDVRFFGGDYGIYTTKPSPGWQFMMLDTYFEGQRKAAIDTREAGLTIVRMRASHVPKVIDIQANFMEKLFMEDCQFSDVSGPAITISLADNAGDQISLRNVDCRNVPVLISYRETGKMVDAPSAIYKIKNFMRGLQMGSIEADPQINTIAVISPQSVFPAAYPKDIPALPAMSTWKSLKQFGATGDGTTDDTKAIQSAIDQADVIYVPQGWYRVSQTIKLKPNTVLIGLNPIATQFILANNTPAFGGFGGPVALLESSRGGNNILTGIGLSTGADNPRAVACKWMAGEHSYLNDVKFIGGHGGIQRIWKQLPPAENQRSNGAYARSGGNGKDPAWDTQYWSLWVTDGGGGTFENIWSANTYATSGVYVSNTSTPGRVYALSVEHHVRNEVRFNGVANWKVYALQLEEESRESTECQPLDIAGCKDITFANLYMFRVIRVNEPYPYSIRSWGNKDVEFLNVHNFSQIKYTTSNPLYSMNANVTVRPWEFNRLLLNDNAAANKGEQLASGFEMPEGICHDSKGNVYFCESRMRHIYKWSADTRQITLLADYPWEPLSLACDKQDNLLVVFKYVPKQGYMVDGKQEAFDNPRDASGTSFAGWGNSGFATWVYSINPAKPDESISLLKKVPMGSINPVYKALYPAHRWRDFHDFNTVTVNRPTECFVAPDGQTIVPVVYDLARSATLSEAWPGKTLYETDEYDKRTVSLSVSVEGYPSNLKYFTEKGEFSTAADSQGNVYVADGQIYVYRPDGKPLKTIKTTERPVTITIDRNAGMLYYTGYNSVYGVRL